MKLVEDVADLVSRTQNVDAVEAHAALARVVIQEADRPSAEVWVELQLARNHLTAGPGADDQHPPSSSLVPPNEPLHQNHADEEPGAADQEDGEQEVADDDRAWDLVVEGLQQQEGDRQDRRRDRAGAKHRDHVRQAEVAPPLLV